QGRSEAICLSTTTPARRPSRVKDHPRSCPLAPSGPRGPSRRFPLPSQPHHPYHRECCPPPGLSTAAAPGSALLGSGPSTRPRAGSPVADAAYGDLGEEVGRCDGAVRVL